MSDTPQAVSDKVSTSDVRSETMSEGSVPVSDTAKSTSMQDNKEQSVSDKMKSTPMPDDKTQSVPDIAESTSDDNVQPTSDKPGSVSDKAELASDTVQPTPIADDIRLHAE
eukprot:948860_1